MPAGLYDRNLAVRPPIERGPGVMPTAPVLANLAQRPPRQQRFRDPRDQAERQVLERAAAENLSRNRRSPAALFTCRKDNYRG